MRPAGWPIPAARGFSPSSLTQAATPCSSGSTRWAGAGPAQLRAIYFYDGAHRRGCQRKGTLALTEPGSYVVHVCPQFVTNQRQDPDQAPVTLIHELLHTLGLGENPPSSDEISRHVRARCGG